MLKVVQWGCHSKNLRLTPNKSFLLAGLYCCTTYKTVVSERSVRYISVAVRTALLLLLLAVYFFSRSVVCVAAACRKPREVFCCCLLKYAKGCLLLIRPHEPTPEPTYRHTDFRPHPPTIIISYKSDGAIDRASDE